MSGLHGSIKSNGGLTALMSSQEEFQEEEVWGHTHTPNGPKSNKLRKGKPGGPLWRRSASVGPASSRPPPSEPVDFPDWDRILKEEARPKKQWFDDDDDVDIGDDDDEEMLPPHELLARRDRKNRAAYSMCEGIGRTLKGRDLRTVRNAVLAKTGFIENM